MTDIYPTESFIQNYQDTNIEYAKIKNIYFPSLITLYKYIKNLVEPSFIPYNTSEFLIKIVNELVDIEQSLNSSKNKKAIDSLTKIKDRYVKALSIVNYRHLMMIKDKKGINPFLVFRVDLFSAIDYVANERKLNSDYNGYESLLNITQKSTEEIKKELSDNIQNVVDELNKKIPQLANLDENEIKFIRPRINKKRPDDFSNSIDDEDDEDDDSVGVVHDLWLVSGDDSMRSSGGGRRLVQQLGSRPNFLTQQLLSRISERRQQSSTLKSLSSDTSSDGPIDPPQVERQISSYSTDSTSTDSTSSNESGFFQTGPNYKNPMAPENTKVYKDLAAQEEAKDTGIYRQDAIDGDLDPESKKAVQKYRVSANKELETRLKGTPEEKRQIKEQDEINRRYFEARNKK